MDDATVELGIDDLTGAVEVGAGGFGTVYKARQTSLRRDVAVKMVTSTVRDEKVRIRFEREIQAMGMLSGHPNIVTVYDSGFTDRGQPYILMDFMDQGSLRDRLDKQGPLPYADALMIMIKVCGALETAHQAGILHRDIKPENVMVSAYGEPKLGDFGIARLKGGPETGTASLTASIEHVSPELLEAKPPSALSDVYALGSTMYKLLTLEAPFVRSTDESIVPALARIRAEPVPDLRARGVPPQVADVVERAMAKDPSDRYASAAEMGKALQDVQVLLGLPRTAMPVRAEEAAAAKESTRTLNSDDIAQSIDDIRASQTHPGAGAAPVQAPAAPSGQFAAGGQQAPAPPGGAAPGYGAPPHGGYPAPSTAPAGGGGSPWVKVGAGVGAIALIAIIGVAVALSGGDDPEPTPPPATEPEVVVTDPTDVPEPTDPPEPVVTEDPEPEEYVAFERLLDDSGTITIDVPRQWADVDGSPWVIDGNEVGQQIVAAEDLSRFRSSWAVPGVIFGASELLGESFDPESLLDALNFGDQCTYEGRSDYTDPAYNGLRDDYSDCGGIGTSYTLIAAEPPDGEEIVLVQFQAVDQRDQAALDRVIETFFVLQTTDPDAPADGGGDDADSDADGT